MVDIAQFKSNFGKHKIPDELLKLCEFQEATGFEELSNGFSLSEADETGLSAWCESKAFLDCVIEFAQANGSGSIYALWLAEPKGELSKQPVIVLGDEGGAHVVAENLKDFLRLLTLDMEPMVDWDEVSFYRDGDDYEPSEDREEYIEWLEHTFSLKPVKSADEILKSVRKKYDKKFRQWASKFIEDIEADSEEDDEEDGDGEGEGAKRRFEFEEGNSSKFWEIQLDGESVTTWWGKIGTAGQSKTLDFDSEAEAKKQYDKLVVEKTKKGYEEVGGGSGGDEDDEDEAPPPRAKAAAPAKAAPAKVAPVKAAAKPAAAKKVSSGSTADGDKRRFEFEEGNSSKFWEIQLDGESLTTWWGKIGTEGQSKTLDFDSEAESKKQYDKLVAEKTKKGYEEVGGSSSSSSDDDDEDDDEEDEAPPPRAKVAAPAKAAPAPAAKSKPAPAAATSGSGAVGEKRRFEFEEGNSSKFWEIQLGQKSLTTWWGKIGTAGQTKTLSFASDSEAEKQYEKLVAEKTKKGYEEID